MTRFLLAVLIAALSPAVGSARTVEIPLPALLGTYTEGHRTRDAHFDLGGPLNAVLGGWIHWAGTMWPGLGRGDGLCGDPNNWFLWPTQLAGRVDPFEPGSRRAYVGPVSGSFIETTAIGPGTPDWTSILDGQGTVRFDLAPAIIICATMVTSPQVTITEASLILDTLQTTAVGDPVRTPVTRLHVPRPNPMRSRTLLEYEVRASGPMALDVLDASGRLVKRLLAGHVDPGRGAIHWDGTDDRGDSVPPAVYFFRLKSNSESALRKVVVLE